MKQILDINTLELRRGQIIEQNNEGIVLICPEEGLELCGNNENGELLEEELCKSMKYLVVELESFEDHSLTFNMDLYRNGDQEEYDMRVTFSILPQVMVSVPVNLQVLDSQELFPPRTEGRLRMMIYGKPIKVSEIKHIRFTTSLCHKNQKIKLKSIYLSDIMPDYSLPNKKMIDSLGQWIPKEWEGKVSTSEHSNEILTKLLDEAEKYDYKYENSEWNSFGGWTKREFNKTGWFHTHYDGERWWLVDPDGKAFFSTGIDCISPGTGTRVDMMRNICSWIPEKEGRFSAAWENKNKGMEIFNYGISNLISAFGENSWWESWAKIIKMYLYKWNVNTIANWSSLEFIRWVQMPYVLPLDVYSESGFPTTKDKIFRDFPDTFSKEYENNSERFAKSLEQFKNDKYMIGYFMRNEPNWGFVYELNIAEEMLANPSISQSKVEFVNRMRLKYSDITMFNKVWNISLESFEKLYMPIDKAASLSEAAKEDLIEFSKEMITRYVEIPAKACKKVDKNHLNLGMRYAFITDPVMLSGYENFDVFSINSYQMNPYSQIAEIGKILNMPIMIGEFHFGALDKGLTAHGIRGVVNQSERGNAYRYYVEQASRSHYFIGAHYFMLNDQSCIGRFDGENYQIGLIDICMQEYKDMTDKIKECHYSIYEVCSKEKKAFNVTAKEIPAVHC